MTAASPSVVWFRHDLRLDDHPAMTHAFASGQPVVPLVVVDPSLAQAGTMGPRRWRRFEAAVRALDRDLRAVGGRLVVRRGDPRAVVPELATAVGAARVLVTRSVTPFGSRRDAAVMAALARVGVPLEHHEGALVAEPGTVGRFRIFGPYHRRWSAMSIDWPRPAPERLVVPSDVAGEQLPAGETSGGPEALVRLRTFLAHELGAYATERDRLDGEGTSRLSADLHLGTISARRVIWETRRAADRDPALEAAADAFLRQLAWRDWAYQRLQPALQPGEPGGVGPDREPRWRDDPAAVDAWRRGETGYPTVDAAMRQLAATGWIGNRARMLVASFLTKHLLVDWRLGEAHFMRELEDGDTANNRYGWRWTAGVGLDAAPYFRIISPVRQGLRFDADGRWVRRWLPELAALQGGALHAPWTAVEGLSGRYPAPIVDDAAARARALAAWRDER